MKRLITWCILLTNYVCNAQQWQWAKHIGSGYQFYGEQAEAITDGTNIYLVGSYGGTLYLPGDTLYSNGNNDIFISKFDASGNLIWAKTLGGNYLQPNNHEDARGVFDPTCNCIYVAGNFKNTANFGNGITLTSLGSETDNFLARMDTSGNFVWARWMGGKGKERNPKINVNPTGRIYLITQTEDSAHFGNFFIPPGGGIVQYDSLGNCLSAEIKFTAPITGNTNGVFLDFMGTDLIIYGLYRSTPFQLDTVTLITQGNYDGFIARADSNGNVKWINTYGNAGVDYIQSITIDNQNNIYATGGFKDSINLGGINLYNNGIDILFAKFDGNGNTIWAKQAFATGASSFGNNINGDVDGNCYVVGNFAGDITLDGFHISTANSNDMFLTRFSNNGDFLGVRHFGQAGGFNSVVDNAGSVYNAGVFYNTIAIGSTSMTALLGQDIYLAKIDAITGIGGGEGRMANNQLLIYANPNQGKCNITVPDDFVNETNLILSIYDNSGKLIQQKTSEMNEGNIKLNLEQEAKGVYNVVLSNKKKSYNGKIVFE